MFKYQKLAGKLSIARLPKELWEGASRVGLSFGTQPGQNFPT